MTVQQVNVRFATTYQGRGTKQFQRDLTTLSGNIKRVSTEAGQEFTRFGRFAQAAGTALMVGVGAALAVGIKAAIDFEDAFAGVRKTVDGSESEFLNLARGIRDMATEIPIAATELAKIGELGGQLGIPVNALEDFIETIAKLGVATNLSTEDAATGIARLGNVMGTSHTDFENLASSLVDLGNNFATTESEILAFGTRLAGIGSTIGLTEGEVLGLSAAFTALGEPAERGATAVQRAFVSMFQAVNQGGEDLETFAKVAGMAADEFVTLFGEDPAQAFVEFARGLGGIVDAGEDVTSILQSVGLGSQRTLGAMLKAAQGVDQIEDAMRRGNRAFGENVALSNEAEERFGTMASQIGILKNQFTDLRIEVGDKTAPAFKDALGFLGGFFNVIKDNMAVLQGLLVLVATLAGAKGLIALGKAIGTLLISVGNLGGAFSGARVAGIRLKDTMGSMAGGANALGGILGGVTIALGIIGTAMARNRQHADAYAAAIRNTVDVLEDFRNGAAHASDVYEAFVTQLGQKTGILDIALDLDSYQDFARRFGISTREMVDLAINDFEEFERRTSEITGQLRAGLPTAEEVAGVGRGTSPDPAVLKRQADLATWARIIEEITVATANLRAEEEGRRREMDLEGRARATAPGGPGAIGMGGPSTEFMEGITGRAADVAHGILTTRDEYNEALDDMLEATRDFTLDFSEEWDDIIADFNESLFDWGTAWDEYESVAALSTKELNRSIDAFIEDQRNRTAALAFVYDEFGEEVGQLFSTLPADLQLALGATLDELGPEAFRSQMDTIMGGWADMSMLAVENAMIMAPTGARTAFQAWVDTFDELMEDMPEHAAEGSQAWIDAVMANFEEFRLGLIEEQPLLASAFDDLVTQAMAELDESRPLMDVEASIRGMTTEEKLQKFRDMGLSWVEAIMLAWGTLPDKMGNVAGNAASRTKNAFAGGIRSESPSKDFMEFGKFAAQGFEIGFHANLSSMNFKTSQPVFRLEAPAPAPDGPSITIVNPQHKDDDILDGLQRATTLTGLTRMAEITRN